MDVPGRAALTIKHIVCDVNGTLAFDGDLLPGVAASIHRLRKHTQVHLITANTHGKQKEIDQVLGFPAICLNPGHESEQKKNYVETLTSNTVIAIGQGTNDAGMLAEAAIGIAILSKEGLSRESLLAADLIFPDIQSAFDCLENPQRIIASLRQ